MYVKRGEKVGSYYYKNWYFAARPIQVEKDWNKTRLLGQESLSSAALLKLEWIIFYYGLGSRDATYTSKQFGITRQTFHKWLKRFKEQDLKGLEENSKAPLKTRKRDISLLQRIRIKSLRTKYPRYGKMKLISIYKQDYLEVISSWKIQKIIEEDQLYFDRVTIQKQYKRRLRSIKRQKITKLVKEKRVNFLWHVDTIILTLSGGGYRYLITAIDEVSKLAYARLYSTHASRNARDFLERLVYVTDQKIINLHTDNGSEFQKEFGEACKQLAIPRWYSRPHTPKDNAVLERFNRTIQEEFVTMTEQDPLFIPDFNNVLTEWLIEYNYHRPHQTLDYKSPLVYLDSYYGTSVSTMYSSLT
ncbi:DDE-type integrase/transposase/recombinase, partial [Patescibacteria group bacterium]|nr:DDE-type integrase/transposase/recombinase [Patescibacteria group bacterium]